MHHYCSNCRRNIVTEGNHCPSCHVQKADSVVWQTLGWMGGCIGAIAGILLYKSLRLEVLPGGWALGAIFSCTMVSALLGAFLVIGAKTWYDSKSRVRNRMREHRYQESAPERSMASVLAPAAVTETAPLLDFAALARRQEAALLASGDYRSCPHCAELVKASAHICRFCQREIVDMPQDR